ncbi:MAG: hypothetical protein JWM80_2188 [Cyanobacteria bacterium RYN_339]|nr:hypothetical protein [Cyanobacteria bacterium RYN_339]
MEAFFLFCFAFGALFTLASTLLGMLGAGLHGLGAHVHLPGAHVRIGSHHGGALSHVMNPSAFLVGLTAFGALGYLGLHHLAWSLPLALGAAAAAGAAGHAALAALFNKLQQDAGTMLDQDYELTGTPADVRVSIPAARCGEIIFTLNGRTRSEAARSLDGEGIPRGTQVVIVGYQQGVAVVEVAQRLLEGPVTERQRLQDPEAESG